jgi:glycosyltransferase involved in cell wall biosynthesis
MKILIIHPDMSFYGGGELVIVRLANCISKDHEVSILTNSISEEVEKELRNVNIITPKTKNEDKNKMKKFLENFFALRNIFEEIYDEYDIINVHNFPAEYIPFVPTPLSKNVVWYCNEPPMPLYFSKNVFLTIMRKIDKYFVRKYLKFSAVADKFNAKRFEKIYGIKPEIIHYGIDYEFFSKGKKKKNKKDFVLIQVATLTQLKNQIRSIKVVENLKEKIPEIKLLLVGWGEENYTKFLKDYVKKKKLEDYIVFTGNVSREEVRKFYKMSDVALFPVKSQGSWLSPFEALSAGVFVIVSNQITCKDIIRKNKLGIVTNNFEEAVLKVYKNKEYFENEIKKAQIWIKKNLTWKNFSEKIILLFERCINKELQ